MRTVEKKIWPAYFDEVEKGNKTFELRIADFEIEPGDLFVLKEWDPETGTYTGRQIEKYAGYIIKLDGMTTSNFHSPQEMRKYGCYVISLLSQPN